VPPYYSSTIDKTAFDRCDLLRGLGYSLTDMGDPGDDAFGAWWIAIDGPTMLRVRWDPNERWSIIEASSARRFDGHRRWKPLWVGKTPESQTPEALAEVLDSIVGIDRS